MKNLYPNLNGKYTQLLAELADENIPDGSVCFTGQLTYGDLRELIGRHANGGNVSEMEKAECVNRAERFLDSRFLVCHLADELAFDCRPEDNLDLFAEEVA